MPCLLLSAGQEINRASIAGAKPIDWASISSDDTCILNNLYYEPPHHQVRYPRWITRTVAQLGIDFKRALKRTGKQKEGYSKDGQDGPISSKRPQEYTGSTNSSGILDFMADKETKEEDVPGSSLAGMLGTAPNTGIHVKEEEQTPPPLNMVGNGYFFVNRL
jgi:hypothetical protein